MIRNAANRLISALCVALVVFRADRAIAQEPGKDAKPELVAPGDLSLGAKTPLGDAFVGIPAGTAITNYEIVGEEVTVRQGPFSATFELADLQPTPEPSPTPEASPIVQETNAATPLPDSPAGLTTGPEQVAETTAAAAVPAETEPRGVFSLPEWVLPAAGGALFAYALFATAALLRPRRRSSSVHRSSSSRPDSDVPVITIPGKARPASVAEGGRAIACPLCRKNIPLGKVARGRNSCPSCHGTFVCE